MDKTLFEDLVGSLQEAKAISKGKAAPSRRHVVTAPDAQAMREALAFETWGASSGPYVPRETLFQR